MANSLLTHQNLPLRLSSDLSHLEDVYRNHASRTPIELRDCLTRIGADMLFLQDIMKHDAGLSPCADCSHKDAVRYFWVFWSEKTKSPGTIKYNKLKTSLLVSNRAKNLALIITPFADDHSSVFFGHYSDVNASTINASTNKMATFFKKTSLCVSEGYSTDITSDPNFIAQSVYFLNTGILDQEMERPMN